MEEKQQPASDLFGEDTLDDTHLTEIIVAATEEVPDTLEGGVWLKINAERKRRRQQRFWKYAGVAACLLIVLPTALRVLPMMGDAKSADQAAAEAYSLTAEDGAATQETFGSGSAVETVPETAAATTAAGMLYAVRQFTGAPTEDKASEDTAPATTAAATASKPTKQSNSNANSIPAPETAAPATTAVTTAATAPKTKIYSMTSPAPTVTEASAARTADDRAADVLRAMTALSVSYDTYLQTAQSPSPADFIRLYKISRADFLAAAKEAGAEFSEEELTELWK